MIHAHWRPPPRFAGPAFGLVGLPSAFLPSTMQAAEGRYRAPKQQYKQTVIAAAKLLGQQQRDQDSKELNYQPAASAKTSQTGPACTPSAPPKSWRLPQPPKKRTVPEWVEDCFVKDEYALVSEEECSTPFLREGVVPQVGMKLYMQMTYEHDGSHPQHYRHWARMMGEITHVFQPPQVGVCAVYEGQQVLLSDQEIQQQRSELPALPPSLFGQNATCSCCRTAEQVVQQYGAVHGQRVQGCIWLMNSDADLEPQLGGEWTVELVANDNLESMWVVWAMERADDIEQQELELQQQEGAQSEQGAHTSEEELRHDQLLALSAGAAAGAQAAELSAGATAAARAVALYAGTAAAVHAVELLPVQQRQLQQTAPQLLQGAEPRAAHPPQQLVLQYEAPNSQQAGRQPQHAGSDSAQQSQQHSTAFAGPAPTVVSVHSQTHRRSRDAADQPAPERIDMHRQQSERGGEREEDQPRQRGSESQPRRRSSESGGGQPAAGGVDRDSQRDHSRERGVQRGWDGDSRSRRHSDDSASHSRDWDRDRQDSECSRDRDEAGQPRQHGREGDRQPRRRSEDSASHSRDWDRDRQQPEHSRDRQQEEQTRQRGGEGDRQPRRRSSDPGSHSRDGDRDRQHPEHSREREVQPRRRQPDSDRQQGELQREGSGDRRSLSDREQQQRLPRISQDGCSCDHGQQRGREDHQQRGGDAHVQQQRRQHEQRGEKREREAAHGHSNRKQRHDSDDRGWRVQDHSWEHDRESKCSRSSSSGRSSR